MPITLDGTTGITSPAIDVATPVTVADGGTGQTSSTGSGAVVLATSPTLITPALDTPSALVGTNITGTANSLNAGLGVNQTWQAVTGSRVSGTTYTNSTGKPILIMVRINQSVLNSVVVVGGVTIITANSSTATFVTYSFIVPNSTTYVVTATINGWSELI